MSNNLAYDIDNEIPEELLNGRQVMMSPRPAVNHNLISGNIFRIFSLFLKGRTCEAFADGTDVYLTAKDRVIPDAMIVCNPDIVKADGIHGTPDLILEVLSPSTANNDKSYKRDLYERVGVKEYWIVEPSAKSIEVYLLKDGKLALDHVYTVYPDFMLEKMKEEELAEVQTEFKTSLYDDLIIRLEDVFDRIV